MKRDTSPIVYVVDDDEAVRDALSMMLRVAGHAVETFASAQEFLDKHAEASTGCLVLDVRMPGVSGLELQDLLAQRDSRLPIVFLTGHGDIPMAVRSVKRGAFEFLEKPVDDARLLEVIEAAITRNAHGEASAEEMPPAAATLSRREREVLDLILKGQRTRAIAEALFISVKTVEFHRSRIHAKLGVGSMAELFTLCFGRAR